MAQAWPDAYRERLADARQARLERRFADHVTAVDEIATRAGEFEGISVVVAAERFRDVGFSTRSDEELRAIRDELGALLDVAPDPAVRARLLLGRGQTHARLAEPGWGAAASHDLRAATRAFVQAGEWDEASSAMTLLAWSVQLPTAGLRTAARSLDEAIELARRPSHAATALSQRAKVRLWLGAVVAAAEDVTAAAQYEGSLDHTTLAYIAWAEMLVHAAHGDRDRVALAHQRGEANIAGWHATVTGVQYDAEVADALAQVGLEDRAWELLARARARRDEDEDAVRRAELELHARIGDPALALEAWEDVRRQVQHEPWERGRLRLLVAHAMRRLGQDPSAVAALAFDETAQHSRPDTHLNRDPDVAGPLLPVAVEGGSSTAAWLHRRRHGWYLDLLDRIELHGPEGEVVPVAGRVATLLAVLVDAGVPVGPERVAAALWPDDPDEAAAVARVRRLLHRIRGMAPVVERDEDGRLRLCPHLASDVEEVRHAAGRARAADGARAREPWLERAGAIAARVSPRELEARDDLPEGLIRELARLLHWIHRALADQYVDEAREDLARQHWRLALALVPDDDGAAVALARSLVGEGLRADALAVVVATRAVLDEAGLRPSPTFLRLETTLQGGNA